MTLANAVIPARRHLIPWSDREKMVNDERMKMGVDKAQRHEAFGQMSRKLAGPSGRSLESKANRLHVVPSHSAPTESAIPMMRYEYPMAKSLSPSDDLLVDLNVTSAEIIGGGNFINAARMRRDLWRSCSHNEDYSW